MSFTSIGSFNSGLWKGGATNIVSGVTVVNYYTEAYISWNAVKNATGYQVSVTGVGGNSYTTANTYQLFTGLTDNTGYTLSITGNVGGSYGPPKIGTFTTLKLPTYNTGNIGTVTRTNSPNGVDSVWTFKNGNNVDFNLFSDICLNIIAVGAGSSSVLTPISGAFNTNVATSQSSINQLITSYNNKWNGQSVMAEFYNLWYYTNTVNNTTVSCRGYYKNTLGTYWNAFFNYDTITGLYDYQKGSGVGATSTNNGLTSDELLSLTLYYPYQGPTGNYFHGGGGGQVLYKPQFRVYNYYQKSPSIDSSYNFFITVGNSISPGSISLDVSSSFATTQNSNDPFFIGLSPSFGTAGNSVLYNDSTTIYGGNNSPTAGGGGAGTFGNGFSASSNIGGNGGPGIGFTINNVVYGPYGGGGGGYGSLQTGLGGIGGGGNGGTNGNGVPNTGGGAGGSNSTTIQNQGGSGAVVIVGTTSLLPSVVSGLSYGNTIGNGVSYSVDISYNQSVNNATGYCLQFNGNVINTITGNIGNSFVINSPTTLTSNYKGLNGNTAYTISAYTTGTYGNSAIGNITIPQLVLPPTALRGTSATSNTINISFTPPQNINVTTYNVFAMDSSGNKISQSFSGSASSYTITGLSAAKLYTINMNSTNSYGTSNISSDLSYSTIEDIGTLNGTVRTIVLDILNNCVYVGGDFITAGTRNITVNYIAKWSNTTNTWSALGSGGMNNIVYYMLLIGSNLYVAGSFTTVNGITTNNMAVYDTVGQYWSNIGNPDTRGIYALAYNPTSKYIYTAANGGGVNNACRIYNTQNNSWPTTPSVNINGFLTAIYIDVSNQILYCGGTFVSASTSGSPSGGNYYEFLVVKLSDHTILFGWTDRFILFVTYFAEYNGKIIITGTHNTATNLGPIVVYNPADNSRSQLSGVRVAAGSASVFNINNILYFPSSGSYGYLQTSAGTNALTVYNGSSWSLYNGVDANGPMYAVAYDSSKNYMYFGGEFTIAPGGKTSNNISISPYIFPPTGLTAISNSISSITITYNTPYSSVSAYTVTAVPTPSGNTITQTYNAPASSYVITGLTSGTTYNITLTATNSGVSSVSVTTSATTVSIPVSPSGLNVAYSNSNIGAIAISYNNISNALSYYISISPYNSNILGSPAKITSDNSFNTTNINNDFVGFLNNTNYTISVFASNLYGNSSITTTTFNTNVSLNITGGLYINNNRIINGVSYTYYILYSTGVTYTISQTNFSGNVNIFAIGGGGGGGYNQYTALGGGGGGGGGGIVISSIILPVSITASIGNGGIGTDPKNLATKKASNGGNTIIGTIIAYGGGSGGTTIQNGNIVSSKTGGSGGGGVAINAAGSVDYTIAGNANTSNNNIANNGGKAYYGKADFSNSSGGGGGGAGGNGGNGSSNGYQYDTPGGIGYTYNITGNIYSAGGYSYFSQKTSPPNGINYGDGGSGISSNSSMYTSAGNGAPGAIIISYPTTFLPSLITGLSNGNLTYDIATNTNGIDISFNQSVNNIVGYNINFYNSANTNDNISCSSGTKVSGNTFVFNTPNTTTYTFTGLNTNKTYYANVYAIGTYGNTVSSQTSFFTTVPKNATGGSTTTFSGGYKIHTFTSSGTFTITSGITSVNILVVGGGGGGGGGGACFWFFVDHFDLF